MPTNRTEPAYLRLGRYRLRIPARRSVRIALSALLLARGLIPTPTSPILLSAAVTLLSVDLPKLRRWRRRLVVRVRRRRRPRPGRRVAAGQAPA